MIPFQPKVSISIPRQRALLVWNGEEQVLFLARDVQASEPTLALEIVPLPAEPGVKTGDLATFERALELIADYLRRVERIRARWSLNRREPLPRPVGEVLAHDTRLAQVRSGEDLIEWAGAYVHAHGAPDASLPARIRAVLDPYLAEGFNWFAFHVVPLSTETQTLRPLRYRFRTPYLFYPLRVARLVAGFSWIQMLSFVPTALRWACVPQLETADLFSEAGYVGFNRSRADLAGVDPEMAGLLGDEDPRLHVWHFGGTLDGLDQDIMLPGGYVLGWDPSSFWGGR